MAAERWPTPRAIRIVRPGERDAVVPLRIEREYQIGRAETVELSFSDETVSRVHGSLRFDAVQGAWVYRDAGSTSGSALVGPGSAGPGERIPPGKGTAVRSGHAVALGTSGNRIDFLEDVPQEALAGPGIAEWRSAAGRALEEGIRAAAANDRPLLLLGPSGSGKTHAAERIHLLGARRGRFAIINCTDLPADPAAQAALAEGGTLFLDEVEALEEDPKAFAPGAVDARLISASRELRAGAGDVIRVPDLRERREDVPLLAQRFLEELAAEQQVLCELSPDAMELLVEQKWPGQVRELRATVRTAAVRSWWRINSAGRAARRPVVVGVPEIRAHLVVERKQSAAVPMIDAPPTADSHAPLRVLPQARKRLADLTREDLEMALRFAGGDRARAAKALGLSVSALRKKMEELGM